MMAGRGTGFTAAGGPARHIPVMLSEVLETLQTRDGDIIVDGTFGAGGYSQAILAAANCKVIAIDQDPDALACGRELAELSRGRLVLALGRYSDMAAIAAAEGFTSVDGVVLDLGVSSMQLDQPERGFSFMGDGPLDMRMRKEGPSASDIVNDFSEQELAEIIAVFGEERRARAIAKAIVKRRSEQPILRTDELAGLVAGVLGPQARRAETPRDPNLPGASPLCE